MTLQKLSDQYQAILETEKRTKHDQLGRYQRLLADLTTQHAHLPPIPPKPLTIPAIFGRSHTENFISDYMAYILDPVRSGLGEAPLACFLDLIGLDAESLSLDEVSISREYAVGGRRIDLLLAWEGIQIVGIENKIHAAEGPSQTVYYARELPKLFPGTPCHFIYLTRGGQRAGSKQFRPLSYKDLWEALGPVSIPAEVSDRQRVLWEDFLEHLEVYIIMTDPDSFQFSEKAKLYIEHQAMLLDLEAAFQQEWGEALNYLEQRLYAHLEGGPWTTAFSPTRGWHQVYKPSWNTGGLFVHYEYWLPSINLSRQETTFTVDVEGKRTNEFLAQSDQRYPALETIYRQVGIEYRPPKRKNAIAWKTYPITPDIEQVAQTFIQAFEEFRFLEKEIDAIVAGLNLPGS